MNKLHYTGEYSENIILYIKAIIGPRLSGFPSLIIILTRNRAIATVRSYSTVLIFFCSMFSGCYLFIDFGEGDVFCLFLVQSRDSFLLISNYR